MWSARNKSVEPGCARGVQEDFAAERETSTSYDDGGGKKDALSILLK